MKNRSNYIQDAKHAKKLVSGLILIGDFLLWIFTAIFLKNLAILVCGALMAGTTVLVSIFLSHERENTIFAFKSWLAGYCASLLVFYFIILALEKSPDSISTSGGISFLTGMYSFVIFMIPIGFITWQAKKIVNIRGILGKSKRETIDYYKDHGNDGSI